jgi:hypothetical protein
MWIDRTAQAAASNAGPEKVVKEEVYKDVIVLTYRKSGTGPQKLLQS